MPSAFKPAAPPGSFWRRCWPPDAARVDENVHRLHAPLGSFPEDHLVRHASQLCRRHAPRRGDGTSPRASPKAQHAMSKSAQMKPTPYGPFPCSPIIRRPRLTWPGDAHVALWVIPNIEFFSLMEKVPAGSGGPGTPGPDIPSWSARDYGNRVGVFRLMAALSPPRLPAPVPPHNSAFAHHPHTTPHHPTLNSPRHSPH